MIIPDLPLIPTSGLLVLIGGGEFSFGETREIDEFLLAGLPAGNRTVAFLPTASGSSDYAVHLHTYFQSIDPSVKVVNVPIYRGRDGRRARNLDLLWSAGLIYIGGGVTQQLLAPVKGTPVETTLRAAQDQGVNIAAMGGAACAFGKVYRAVGMAEPAEGLNWLRESVIETNFADDVPLRRLMSIPEINLGLGIPRSTALAIGRDGSGEVLGQGKIAVMRRK